MPRALGIGLGMPFGGRVGAAAWSPTALFAASEQGVWYNPSDFSTLFQDSAGATPVTAVEQNVGRINDKSGNGNHASQSSSGSRPVLRARYNQVTYSEDLSNAAWTKTGGSITSNATTAPDGTTTADLMTGNGTSFVAVKVGCSILGNAICSLYVKAGTETKCEIWSEGSASQARFDLSAVTATNTGGTNASIEDVGDGWFRISTQGTVYGNNVRVILGHGGPTLSTSMYIWGVDCRSTTDGVGLPAYQRIAAATDYDTVGFLPYLQFDGSDDSLATAAIDFSATDEMTFFVGTRRLGAFLTSIFETSADSGTNNGSFALFQNNVTVNSYSVRVKGSSTAVVAEAAPYAAPTTNVITGQLDIGGAAAADEATVRVDGAAVTPIYTGTDTGSGNFGNHALYIGSRAGSSFRFNGRLYSLLVRGKTSTADEITAAEAWVNGKTGAY
jgi:hypothetical protein